MSDLDLIYTKAKKPALTATQSEKRGLEIPAQIITPDEQRDKERIFINKQVSKIASKQVITQASVEERILASLRATDLKANTFRYTQEELDFIRDIVYEAETKHGVKLDKNDIARLSLEWLMIDWEERKQDSLLAKVLANKKASK